MQVFLKNIASRKRFTFRIASEAYQSSYSKRFFFFFKTCQKDLTYLLFTFSYKSSTKLFLILNNFKKQNQMWKEKIVGAVK